MTCTVKYTPKLGSELLMDATEINKSFKDYNQNIKPTVFTELMLSIY